MFGFFKKGQKQKTAKAKKTGKPSREELLAEAKASAAKARTEIGQENIEKMAAALRAENMSEGKKAREQIKGMDQGTVADHLKIMLDEDKS